MAMWTRLVARAVLATLFVTAAHASAEDDTITVGSKAFTESRLLAEIMAQLIETETDLTVERRFGLGGTKIAFEALRGGEPGVLREQAYFVLSAIRGWRGDRATQVHESLRAFLDAPARDADSSP